MAASPQILKKGRGSAAGCVEGLHRFAQGATAPAALRVADCRSAAMLIKSALRDDLAVSYGMISILQWKTIQPRLQREVGLFSRERSPVVRFYHKRAPSINLEAPPQPSRRRRVKLKNLRGDSPVSRVDGIRLLCPPLTEPYVRFSRIRLLE